MKHKLQNVIFPTDEKLKYHWNLFYSGPSCVLDETDTKLQIPSGVVIGFATYLNGFSLEKWKRYTSLTGVELELLAEGHFRLELVGFSLNPTLPERHELYTQEYNFIQPQKICVPFPADAKDQLLAFEIHPYSESVLHGGGLLRPFPRRQ